MTFVCTRGLSQSCGRAPTEAPGCRIGRIWKFKPGAAPLWIMDLPRAPEAGETPDEPEVMIPPACPIAIMA